MKTRKWQKNITQVLLEHLMGNRSSGVHFLDGILKVEYTINILGNDSGHVLNQESNYPLTEFNIRVDYNPGITMIMYMDNHGHLYEMRTFFNHNY